MSDVLPGRGQLDRLIELLLVVPAMSDSRERDAHVEALAAALRRPTDFPRAADARDDLASVLRSCVIYTGALRLLVQDIRRHHPSEASDRAATAADEIVGGSTVLLSGPDREALRRALVDIPVKDLFDAIGDLSEVPELSSVQVWRDMVAVIRIAERLPSPPHGVPPLVAFVDRLAHVVAEDRSAALHAWIDSVAGGLGVTPAAVAALHPDGAVVPAVPAPVAPAPETGRIWGDVPGRNRNFTGRVELLEQLQRAVRTSSKASVLPQTLQGLGGVGKTQLVIEYVYRHAEEYKLIWWVAAEQTSTILSSLARLAYQLGLPNIDDRPQTAATVLSMLADSDFPWLIVYDNADDPDTIDQFMPSKGGHVILTTRNQQFAAIGPSIVVDVFERAESVELLSKRSRDREDQPPRISPEEADLLAGKLHDLPLALEQAVAWHLATAMPIKEYIELLDGHIAELLAEGKPANYPESVVGFVKLALERLRAESPATAQMFELFAYLGGEPVPVSLLRYGKDADIRQPLRETLGNSVRTNRLTRDLNRHGLAKLDAAQRLQVHRLVQVVLRETLPADEAAAALLDVQNLLARANPGDPDEHPTEHARQREVGPHLATADMVNSRVVEARQAVLDHARLLYLDGDYENSRLMAEGAVKVWETEDWHPRLGPSGEFTLLAKGQVANAARTLGDSAYAARVAREAYDGMRTSPLLGPDHEFTLITGNQVGADLRIAGSYPKALEFEQESVDRHVDLFGPTDTYTLRARTNLAVNYRMIGDFTRALAIDAETVRHWQDAGGADFRELEARMNVARDYYGMGAYKTGLAELERWLQPLQDTLEPGHRLVLLAARTHAIMLRKAGRIIEALEVIRQNHQATEDRFGEKHEYTVAAMVSRANALRQLGELSEADGLLDTAITRYATDFGEEHPLTLVARVNRAMVWRAQERHDEARERDEAAYRSLSAVLGEDHPYTLCAATAYATDLSLAGRHDEALRLSTGIIQASQRIAGGGHEAREGAAHPYVLMRAVNLAHDLRAVGDRIEAEALLQESLSGLRRSLGPTHPEVLAAENGLRSEGDIEPPPT